MDVRRCWKGTGLVAAIMVAAAISFTFLPSMLTIENVVDGARRAIIVAALLLSAAMLLVSACRKTSRENLDPFAKQNQLPSLPRPPSEQ